MTRVTKDVLLTRLLDACGPQGNLAVLTHYGRANRYWCLKSWVGLITNTTATLAILAIPLVWWAFGCATVSLVALVATATALAIRRLSTNHVFRAMATDPSIVDELYRDNTIMIERRRPRRGRGSAAATPLEGLEHDSPLLRAGDPWWQPFLRDGELPPE